MPVTSMSTRAPSHRVRFFAGVLLAAGIGSLLAHRFAAQALGHVSAETERRKAVVTLNALHSLVGRAGVGPSSAAPEAGEALRKALPAWQAQTPLVAHARVLLTSGQQLVASTAPADSGERVAPRRLAREEKPFYDRGQRIATAVRTNREEQTARKPEIEIEPVGSKTDPRLSLAAPIEADDDIAGMVEIQTATLPAAPVEPWMPYLLGILAPLVLFFIGALFLGERRWVLAGVAVVLVAGSLVVVGGVSTARVHAERRLGAQAVAELVKRQLDLVKSLAAAMPAPVPTDGQPVPAPAPFDTSKWDVDAFRRPLGLLTADGAVDVARIADEAVSMDRSSRRSLWAADLLALFVLLLVGLGGAHAVGATLKRHRQAYVYIAPAMIGMLVLVFFPFFYGIALSFTDSNLYNASQPLTEVWNGLHNYKEILGDFSIVKQGESGSVINYYNFYWTLGFTVVWTITNVTIGVTSGLILALILNTKGLAMRPIYRVLLILPWAMPTYITALIWKGMFHRQFGVMNNIIAMFGGDPVSWFDKPFTSYMTALITNGWLSFPFMMVVALGALQSIPADLYEAARVDGASRWQAFRAITLPSLRPALVPAIVLSVVWTFNQFNVIYLVTGGEPAHATEILVTQSYKFAFEQYRYGYAAAYSTVIFGILLLYSLVQNRISRATEA